MKSQNADTILFLTDFSEVSMHALYFAIDFCKKADYKLLLLNVVDIPFTDVIEEEKQEIDLVTHDLIAHSDWKLTQLKNQLKKENDFEAESATYTGETTEAIIRAVTNFSIKKIIMGTKENKEVCFKSTSFLIVKKCLVPLLTISVESPITEINNILFPFNEKTITLKKVDEVIKLAELFNSKIHLLGVSEGNTPEKINIITNQMMHIKSLFDEAKIDNEVHFYANPDYAEAILEYCNLTEVDLISIANNHTNTLKANLSLSTTKTIIKNAHVPVLTIPVWQGI